MLLVTVFRQTLEEIQKVVSARLFRSAAAIQRIARGYVARKKVRGLHACDASAPVMLMFPYDRD